MKKIILFLALCLTLNSWAQTKGIAEEQDPKCMTILPMDSTILISPFNEFPANATLTNFTVIASDITEKFVGNTITSIAMSLPADTKTAKILIVDVNATSEATEILWSADVTGYTPDEICKFPCDFYIDKAYDLQIGYSVTFAKKTTPNVTIVATNRYYGWYVTDDVYCNNQYYNYSDYLSFYGYKMYTGLACYCFTEGPAGLKDTDIYMEGADVSRSFIGTSSKISATYRNYGVKPVTSAEFKYVLNGQSYTKEHNQPMGYLESATVEAPFDSPSEPLRQSLEIYASKVNGEVIENPMKSVGSVITIKESENIRRKAVMEEYTQMQCGWCPRGIVALEELTKKYPDDFYAIAEHFNDDCYVESYYPAMQKYCGGSFPSAYLNRVTKVDPYYGTSSVYDTTDKNYQPLPVTADIEKIFVLPTEAGVEIKSAQLDASGDIITVTSETKFNIASITCPYTMAYTLTEDSLEDCLQENYFALDVNSYKNEPYLKSLTKEKQWYMAMWSHVGRGIWESEEKLAETIAAGQSYKNSIQFELPGNISGDYVDHETNWKNVNLIALLLDDETGEIVNAKRVKISEILSEEDCAKLGILPDGINSVKLTKPEKIYGIDGRERKTLMKGVNVVGGRKTISK